MSLAHVALWGHRVTPSKPRVFPFALRAFKVIKGTTLKFGRWVVSLKWLCRVMRKLHHDFWYLHDTIRCLILFTLRLGKLQSETDWIKWWLGWMTRAIKAPFFAVVAEVVVYFKWNHNSEVWFSSLFLTTYFVSFPLLKQLFLNNSHFIS